MASEFKLGITTSIYDFLLLSDLLPNKDVPNDPDWSFQKYATAIQLGDGKLKGQGFPIAKWRFNHISNAHRETLRTICADLSADVYIRTPTNELDVYGDLEWKTFSCIMSWNPEDEEKAADQTLAFILTFTHLIEAVE